MFNLFLMPPCCFLMLLDDLFVQLFLHVSLGRAYRRKLLLAISGLLPGRLLPLLAGKFLLFLYALSSCTDSLLKYLNISICNRVFGQFLSLSEQT